MTGRVADSHALRPIFRELGSKVWRRLRICSGCQARAFTSLSEAVVAALLFAKQMIVDYPLGAVMFFRPATIVLLFLSFAAIAGDTVPWRGVDIQSRMIGNTIVGEAQDLFGAAFMIYFHPDGRTRGVAEKFSITVTDTGRWEIDGHRICVQWTKWEGNERLCRTTVTQGGEILMFDADGVMTSRQTIRKGNPFNL